MRDLREITVFPFESMSSRQSAYKLYGSPSGRRILIGHKNHVMALRRIGPRMLEYRRNKRLILGHSTYPSVIRQFLCLYSGRIQREKGWSAIIICCSMAMQHAVGDYWYQYYGSGKAPSDYYPAIKLSKVALNQKGCQ